MKENYINNVICRLCTGHSYLIYTINDYLIYKCNSCGFTFVHPSPDKKTIQNYYKQGYYKNEYRYQKVNEPTRRLWLQRIKNIESYSRYQNGKSLLDVGCATGIFLLTAAQYGWEVFGIEQSQYAYDIAAQKLGYHRISNLDFLEYQSSIKFHALSAWDVIEHVTHPGFFLQKANSLLFDGGILALSTININSLNQRLFKNKWRYFTPPEHLSFFHQGNLKWLLKKKALCR